MASDGDAGNELASRLALFDDEPDINDWFEVALGAAMITMGLHQLFNPGGLFETGVMQWLGAAVVALDGEALLLPAVAHEVCKACGWRAC